MKSNKRLKIFHTSGSEEVPSASISDLPNDLLKHCFSFIPGSYITIAPVSRHFFSNYCTVGVPELANVNSADNLLKIDQNKMTTAFGVSSVELTELAILSNAPSKFIHRVCYRAALNDRKDIIDCALLYRVDFTEVSHDNFFGKLLLKLAKKGDLDMIKYIDNNFGKSFKSYLYVWRGIYRGAASKTHMHILKWLLERYPEFSLGADPFDGRQIRNVPFCDASTVSVDVLQWTKENIEGFRFTEMIFRAASFHGNLEVLQYCHRNKCPSSQRSVGSCLLNKNKAEALKTLKWFHQHDYSFDESTCTAAAYYENLDALIWLRSVGCPWDAMTFAIAVRRGNFPLLDYLIRNECPIDSNACLFAMKLEDESMVLRLFNWLCRHNCPWHEKTINSAAKKGHLVMLNHFKQNGYGPFDASVSVSALKNKDHSKALHTLKWLLEQSFPLHEDLCNQAFSKKNFEAMIWAAENGCRFRLRIEIDSFLQYLRLDVMDSFLQHFHDEFSLEDLIWSLFYHNKNSDILTIEKCKLLREYYGWDSKFSIEAADNGNIKILQWLMQNRCPGDAMVCTNAVRKGDFNMLKCAHKLGCDLAKEAYAFCLIDGGLEVEVDAIPTEPRESHVEIFNYLKQHNCPRPQDNHWYLRT